jgi:hypothetical protein
MGDGGYTFTECTSARRSPSRSRPTPRPLAHVGPWAARRGRPVARSPLHRRLARLETQQAAAGRGGPCPECGHDPSYTGPIRSTVNLPRVIGEPDDPGDDPSKDICSTRGWKRVWRIPSPRLMGREDGPNP